MNIKIFSAVVLTLAVFQASCADAPKPVLKEGERVAVVGDSITEWKLYSKYIELYLTACMPQLKLRCLQFGWGGETAGGFKARMENDLMPYKPDVVTLCYGMNDGGYQKYNDGIGGNYKRNLADIVARLKETHAAVVVGGPGAVDTKYYVNKNPQVTPAVYNDNLKHLDELAKKIAEDNGFNHADVHTTMMMVQNAAKEKNGADYDVCGTDGVHPGPNGSLVMAYAFLKAMGIDGNIGTITVDMKGAADASDGHKVLSAANGKVEVESARSPFCFPDDPKSRNNLRGILPFLPFNQDLNRFVLIVKNLGSEKAKVDWGGQSQTFTKAELEKGVNLADKFLQNPFSAYFAKLEAKVSAKEAFETQLIKNWINSFMAMSRSVDNDPEVVEALSKIKLKLLAKHEKISEELRALVAPVKHTITVSEEK